MTLQSVLITGANAGLGREAARQLAQRKGMEKIYLACRNLEKAKAAKAALMAETGRDIFEIIIMDVSDADSVRSAVAQMTCPVDAVILNAGGTGGTTPIALTKAGVTHIYAANVHGHVVLVNELLSRQLVTSTVLYAASEAVRGIPKMGMARPDLASTNEDEFISIANGAKFGPDGDPFDIYSYVKLMAVLWMGSMARQHPHIRFVSMSPGGTTGTAGFDNLPFIKRVIFKHVGGILMPLLGMMHSVEKGAQRYVEGLLNPKFETGHFYASGKGSPTGPIVDQAAIDSFPYDQTAQDNAHRAIQQFA